MMRWRVPDPEGPAELPLAGRVALGLLLGGTGVVGILASLDRGPLRWADIHGPPWLAFVVGGIFLLSGLLVAAGQRASHHPLSYVMVFLVIAGFAAIGNWIAFGAGPRVCSVGFTGFSSTSTSWPAQLLCRGGFGIGALTLDGVLFWMLAKALGRALGPGQVANSMEKVGEGVMLLCLLPILLPLLLLVVGRSLFEVVRDYARTGEGPRNEGGGFGRPPRT